MPLGHPHSGPPWHQRVAAIRALCAPACALPEQVKGYKNFLILKSEILSGMGEGNYLILTRLILTEWVNVYNFVNSSVSVYINRHPK